MINYVEDDEDWLIPLNERDEILPGLWMGGCPKIIPKGFTAIVNCCGEKPKFIPAGLIYVDAAFEDRTDIIPEAQWLVSIADTINALRPLGNVLVHCQAGLNRSGLVLALALIRSSDMTAQEAVSLIRKQRNDYCLRGNTSFLAWLHRYEVRP